MSAALRRALERWQRDHHEAPEADAAGAERCGLHVLAELIRLRDRLEQAAGPMSG